ncbi:MAG TPA: hypothetical protein VMR25_16160, partial [Planctomycetaceae bacterium]|nr:hypothetical protein [Planctomycetaceae bacterium]
MCAFLDHAPAFTVRPILAFARKMPPGYGIPQDLLKLFHFRAGRSPQNSTVGHKGESGSETVAL